MVDNLHFIDLPVTAHTTDATVHMNRMVEIGMLRRLVDLHPFQWLAALPGVPHQLEFRAVRLDLRMAVHADLSGRNVGVGCCLHVGMAVPTIHSELAGVDLVGKGDGLGRLVSNPHILGIEIIPNPGTDTAAQHDQAEDDF